MFAAATLALTFLLSTVLALPSPRSSGCNISKATMPLPSGASTLVAPSTPSPRFIGIGVGVQNYTCSTAGTFTSVGAVAELFDISCLNPSTFNSVGQFAFDAWKLAPKQITAADLIQDLSFIKAPVVLGQHFFIPNPTGTGLSPEWNFSSASEKGHPNAFVVGAKAGDIPAPSNPGTNVDWLELNAVEGDLASQVYRIETIGGQPPTSCTPGSPEISVKYVSQYWFFGGSAF